MQILRYCYSIIRFLQFLANQHNVRYNMCIYAFRIKEDTMKKRTINIILMSIIGLLIVAICVLIVQILNRPRYTATSEPQTTVITEIPHSEAVSSIQESQPAEPKEEISEENSSLRGKASTKVNIRELPSEDARVLETIEAGTEFDIIEVLPSGWTMIQYQENMDAYISSSYVILIP